VAEAYPLQWPEGWSRTPAHRRRRAPYKYTPEAATQHLLNELKLLGAYRSSIVISTNVPLRRDGLPYAGVRPPEDPGVAVHWSTTTFKDRVIACDKWDRVHDNIHALGLAIAGMRAIDRAGATQVMERAFTTFGALPPSNAAPVDRAWWEVFEIKQAHLDAYDAGMLEARYRDLARKAHPDQGGSEAAMTELNRAREEMRRHFGGGS
jgi:hypothetical protein